jgi:predicted nucleic acid-binding protein
LRALLARGKACGICSAYWHFSCPKLLGFFLVVFTAKTPQLHIVEKDPDDSMFIECAAALKAEFVITVEKALQAIQKYMNIKIVSPNEFLTRFYREGQV